MITITEASKKYNISQRTLRHWCSTGKVKAGMVGKTWLITDEEFLNSLKVLKSDP